MQLIYCMMCQNRLSEVKQCVDRALPYVDHIVVVDGGSIDESIFYFRNWSMEEPKLHFYLHPWTDNFSAQRTNYLRHADEFAKPGDIIIVSDPDELFEEKTWQNMRAIGDYLNKSQYNSAGLQCRSVSLKGAKRVWENLDDYWKHLIYKWYPGMKYTGNPHETLLVPGGLKIVKTEFLYEHIKQENVIWLRGARNAYINGGGPNLGEKNLLWVELKNIVIDVYGRLLSWHEFEREMMKGNIDDKLKGWMYKAKDETGWDGASEQREFYKTYFRCLWPSEEPEEFRGTSIE